MSSDGHEIRPRESTAYDAVKQDVIQILRHLNARITHVSDGTPLGDSCWGFLLGELHQASRRWNVIHLRQSEVERLHGVIDRLKTQIAKAYRQATLNDCRTILLDAQHREETELARMREAASARAADK